MNSFPMRDPPLEKSEGVKKSPLALREPQGERPNRLNARRAQSVRVELVEA